MKARIPLEPLRGFRDLLPPDSKLLSRLIEKFRKLVELHGYSYVIPPTLERFQLFALKSGEEIRRTMYVFRDKAGREVALRPEATASIARIYLKHLRGRPKPLRLYYVVNCFRYEEPQFARYREFWQAGVELLGLPGIEGDIEVAKILLDYYDELHMLNNITLKVNNIAVYRKLFSKYHVPEEEQDRILHYMDKKEYEKAAGILQLYGDLYARIKCLWDARAPKDATACSLGEEAEKHLEELETFTDVISSYKPGANIDADLTFARGLAYYDGIVFEVKVRDFPVSIAGGGRYSGLISLYGGEDVPGTGFAVGVDRTAAALQHLGLDRELLRTGEARVAIITLSTSRRVLRHAYNIQGVLVKHEIPATITYGSRKTLKKLGKLVEVGYTHAIIVGEREAEEGTITLRDLRTRQQTKYKDIEGALIALSPTETKPTQY